MKLVQVQIFYRHGARTPLHSIFSSTYPEGGAGYGMLTKIGQKQLLQFGEKLRRKYIESSAFISKDYNEEEVLCRSTFIGRNIRSTKLLLAGLYPNESKEIPIYCENVEEEYLYPNTIRKPSLVNTQIEGHKIATNSLKHQEFKEIICNILGIQEIVDKNSSPGYVAPVYYARDDFIARQVQGLAVPNEFLKLEKEFSCLSAEELNWEQLGPKENWKANLKFCIGPVIHEILFNIQKYRSLPRMKLYAVHDSAVMPMLVCLDSFDDLWPPFASSITFELYHNGSDDEATLMPKSDAEAAKVHPEDFSFGKTWNKMALHNYFVRAIYNDEVLKLGTISSPVKGSVEGLVPLSDFVNFLMPHAMNKAQYLSN